MLKVGPCVPAIVSTAGSMTSYRNRGFSSKDYEVFQRRRNGFSQFHYRIRLAEWAVFASHERLRIEALKRTDSFSPNGDGSGLWVWVNEVLHQRLITASVLASFATSAIAENIVVDDLSVKYVYTYETLGSLHFCDLATVIAKVPIAIKLTSAFVTDDAKPKNQDVTVVYVVDAFIVRVGKDSQLESKSRSRKCVKDYKAFAA
jgi:hypothetical protein